MSVHIIYIYTRTKGKCSFERTKRKFSAELGSFQDGGFHGPFLLKFGQQGELYLYSLLTNNIEQR